MATDPSTLLNFSLADRIREKVHELRFGLNEFSGALGDMGTFIPLVAGVSIVSGMDIGVILLFAGLFNLVSGILFGLPIPVQPMKAIAAVVIAEGLAPAEIAAAGLIVGGVVFVLGVTRLTGKLERVIPKSVVRGIQLGIGAELAIKGIEFILSSPLLGVDSITMAAVLALGVIVSFRFEKLPTALLLFIIGLFILFFTRTVPPDGLSTSLINIRPMIPSAHDWINGLIRGAIPQLPLTLLNSVIAVCLLSEDLFHKKRLATDKIAISVGLMNLIGCWFGGLPMCHGSGGLAGQYRFGARTGGSVVMLGVIKVLVGVFFGASAMWMLNTYPVSVLGILLLFAGLELAKPARDQRAAANLIVVLVTSAGIVMFNTLVGFLIGCVIYMLIRSKVSDL